MLIANASGIPIYTFWDVNIGKGIVGGHMISYKEEAKAVARLGLRVLKGEKPAGIPTTQSLKHTDMFDWHQLKRWSISENRLPAGSIVKFKEYSFLHQYKELVLLGVCAFIFQSMIIFILLISIRKRRQFSKLVDEKLQFEALIVQLSSEFINLAAEKIDDKINDAISQVGTFMKTDRCFLFRFDPDKTEFHISHLWEAKGVVRDQTVRGKLVKDIFPWLYDNIINNQDIIVSDVKELLALKAGNEFEYCRQIGIQSFIIIPIKVSDNPLCAMGLDSIHSKREWTSEDAIHLRVLGEVFANALGHKHSEKNILEAYVKIKDLTNKLEIERDYLQEEIKLEKNHDNIIGKSDALKYVLYRVEQVAVTDSTVLILGETGTGKELVARAIHKTGLRRERPFIKVNCATLPASLIESELFGHEKGSFTGAVSNKIGRFEIADNATLFLDEIGELPLELQAKLLRVIEDGEFERVGGSKVIKVDVRIVAATNRSLKVEMKKGRFREDLWYRLNVYPITTPPLRERKEDIPSLVSHFVDLYSRQIGKTIEKIPKATFLTLEKHDWSGNIRELQHVIERAVINSPGPVLRLTESAKEWHDKTVSGNDDFKPLAEFEREYILKVLNAVSWKIEGKSGAAEILEMNSGTLRSRMKKMGIQRDNRT